ncbi:MAG: LPS assembly lipoprotein LptE [Nitrospirota bacterium]
MQEKLKNGNHLARRAFLASLACLAAASLTLAACGYQFRVEGAGPTLGVNSASPKTNAPRMQIVDFENMTLEPNIELRYTIYARREFSQASGARVVAAGEPADLILKAKINSVALPTINFSLQGTFEGRVTVNVMATVEDVKTRSKIWTQNVAASSEFFMTDDLQFNRVLQTRAVEQAGRLIAADLAMRFQNFMDLRDKTAATPAPASGAANGTPQPDKPGVGGMPAK